MIRFKGKIIERRRQKVLDILTDRKREKREKVCHRERETERERQRQRQRERQRERNRKRD